MKESTADRLIVLGDFLHAPIEGDSPEALDLAAWAQQLEPAKIVVVAGNHDRGAPQRWSSSITWREGVWSETPLRFVHDASHVGDTASALFTLSGHVHPVLRLRGMRVPVFWRRATGLVLPSFGRFTGGFAVDVGKTDQIFAAGPSAVVRLR